MTIDAIVDIMLEDTFVFSWHQTPESLIFNVLAHLLASHPDAAPPAMGDWSCYRSAVIEFSCISSVTGLLLQESVKPTIDPDGSVDYGCIDELVLLRPGEYRISGEFGVVNVSAKSVSIELRAAV